MTEWDSDLSNAALLVWDMQPGIALKSFNLNEIVANIKNLIDVMHSKGRPVIFTQTTGLPYELQSKYSIYRARRRGTNPKSPPLLEGSPEWQLMSDFEPFDQDLVIKKYSPSLFVGTAAEQFLRNKDVDCLIITGVSTEVGVETTARHASCLGFVPVIAQDAVGSGDKQLHEYSLAVMRVLFEVKTTSEISQSIKNSRDTAR